MAKRMSDMLEPKNSWILMYEKVVLDQYFGLLIEMITASNSLELRYDLVKYREPEGPLRDFSFNREENMKSAALNGVGTALIIGTDTMIKEVENQTKKSTSGERGNPIKTTKWVEAVRAASNYVRHGDEWESLYHQFCIDTDFERKYFDFPPGHFEEFSDSLQGKYPRALKSMKVLLNSGISYGDILTPNSTWTVANGLKLLDADASMRHMSAFLDSHYVRKSKRKK